jgi:hypothetical protein
MPTQEKIEALKKRKAEIEKQISAAEARLKAKERKEETHLKVLIGAAMIADSKVNPETIGLIETILNRAIKEKRDQDFLKAKGWFKNESGQ